MEGFFLKGEDVDLGYKNIRDLDHNNIHENARQFIQYLWSKYAPLADPHFREDAQNHFIERFWEMYLAVSLLDRGFSLNRYGHEGPEFYFMHNDKKFWVEAIAPGPGTGPDRVPEIKAGLSMAQEVPTENILLRFTSAVAEKKSRYFRALDKGIVSEDDGYILAINSRAIPHAPYGNTLPYFTQALLPIGPLEVSFDRNSERVDSQYQYRGVVQKQSGTNIPTTAFLDPEYGYLSAVLHSAVDCVNRPELIGDDYCILHNPNADKGIDSSLFSWARQMHVVNNELITNEPNNSLNSTPEDGAN
jgi:hypothetical protein